jgi:hypothetical protein
VRRRDATLNIDRALRAVAYALLGLTAPALVMPVRFVPPERRYGIRAVGLTAFPTAAPVTPRLVSR